MNLGFGVSDFVVVSHLARKLYNDFKEAPGTCREFAKELKSFHQVLEQLEFQLHSDNNHLTADEFAILEGCADSCKELIYVQIYGASNVPSDIQTLHFLSSGSTAALFTHPALCDVPKSSREANRGERCLKAWRRRWAERKFAARIPELRDRIRDHIRSLSAFNSLIIRSGQIKIFGCLDRREALHEQTKEFYQYARTSVESLQIKFEAASERSSAKLENLEFMLQSFLAAQQRQERPILSQSLDTSSPEGRETWKELRRLLDREGIQPAMIKQNRGIVVKAIKTALQENDLLSNSESYHTAFESFSSHHRTLTNPSSSRPPAQASLSLLSSAPPRAPTFSDEFLERHHGAARSIEQDTNIQGGLEFLLEGMEAVEIAREPEDGNEDDGPDLEGLNEAGDTTETDSDNAQLRPMEQNLKYNGPAYLSRL